MNYMVLECHPGYAVVLDEEGHFLKVANRQYEVGQMVTDVVQMQVPPKKKAKKWIYSLAAMAACLALILTLVIPGFQQPYACYRSYPHTFWSELSPEQQSSNPCGNIC